VPYRPRSACPEFALGAGVDAVSQSFVERAADIEAVRAAAATIGHSPFVIAKIERLTRWRTRRSSPPRMASWSREATGAEVPIEKSHTHKH
jgi:pyruvate kinase